jgi:tetratricopeptide (TPR) repeat protein
MVSFNLRRRSVLTLVAALMLVSLGLALRADDQIFKKDGTSITGQIISSSGGQVMVAIRASNGSINKIPYYISDIKSIAMATPPEVTKVQGGTPDAVIAALEPVVKNFAGLPADWVVTAMAQLAGAYTAKSQSDKALALYNEIDTLYPGSAYHVQAVAGKAELSLKAGKVDEALAALQPIVDEANKNMAPSPADGALYASAFIVYGQTLEAQKKNGQALEAYLTVKTMYYQNPALADQADQLAKALRDKNPGLGVD